MTSTADLVRVSSSAAHSYAVHRDELVSYVNSYMEALEDLAMLIGDSPLSVMLDNHKNHADFMSAYLKINQSFLLVKTIKWVFSSYEARGFSPDYFKIVLPVWQQAVSRILPSDLAAEINLVYDWMIASIVVLRSEAVDESMSAERTEKDDFWLEQQQLLLSNLLSGNPRAALDQVNRLADSSYDLESVYTHLIMPSLYDVGRLWEQGQISIAHEHLSTSIIIRIMSSLYSSFCSTDHSRGTAIVSSSVNDHHEIGARMVADVLELNGWNVYYLGANTPIADLIMLIREEKPHILALSVTMSFNLPAAIEIVEQIKLIPIGFEMKIILGGYALQYLDNYSDEDLDKIDFIASTLEETISQANRWWDSGAIKVYDQQI